MLPADTVRAARDAHRHADTLITEAERRYPGAWDTMTRLRTTSGLTWPDWCLLPMAGAVAAITERGPITGPADIAAISALYAWRYTRSVWTVEPNLMRRLLGQVPDALDLDALTPLPEWCVYVIDNHPEWPGLGVWIHLEHDINTGRPELRLLIDQGGRLDELQPIPVYLDRPSVTEALADMRATTLATLGAGGQLVPGGDVHGADPDAAAANLADRVDGYLALAAYLARPEADITRIDRPGVQPVRYRSLPKDRAVWAVGYPG